MPVLLRRKHFTMCFEHTGLAHASELDLTLVVLAPEAAIPAQVRQVDKSAVLAVSQAPEAPTEYLHLWSHHLDLMVWTHRPISMSFHLSFSAHADGMLPCRALRSCDAPSALF